MDGVEGWLGMEKGAARWEEAEDEEKKGKKEGFWLVS